MIEYFVFRKPCCLLTSFPQINKRTVKEFFMLKKGLQYWDKAVMKNSKYSILR